MAISWWTNRKIVVTAITVTVATVTTIIRFTGGFESLELKRYDYFFSKRAISSWDQRIVIVGYTEEDREKYGESAPDKEMTQVLEKLRFSNATTIGLFFKRDQKPSIGEDRKKLNQQIQLMDNLIQTNGQDKLSPEPDNIVRKIQLYKQSSTEPSIVYEVSKHYLQLKGARIKETKNPPSIIIKYSNGKEATIRPLTVLSDGGYNTSYKDLINFPVLISWPFNKRGFETYSFSDIINNNIPDFKDKIVIVGSMKDRSLFKVPIAVGDDNYSFSSSAEVGGIVISNLLNQAEVPFVRTWTDPIEYLYLYGWLVVSGAWILWMCEELDPAKKWAKYILSIVIASGVFLFSIYTISLVAFPKVWIPSVFVGRSVFVNVILCSFTCLELKVREEQSKRLEKQKSLLQEQKQRLKDKEKLEEEKKREIKTLKTRLLSQERLAFFGKLSPFIRHEIIGLYDDFYRKIARIEKMMSKQEKNILEILPYLEDSLDNDEFDEYTESLLNSEQQTLARLQEMEDILQKSSDLITRFFPLVREDSTDSFILPQSLDLNELLRECTQITTYNFKYSEKHNTFNINIVEELDENLLFFWGVSSELRFIFVNLIENAYYAVIEKHETETDSYTPTVWIKTQQIENTIQIIIQDNGIGINPNFLEKIFEPLFTTKTKYKQTGVGLSLTKDLLELNYNALIEVKSDQGLTSFIVTFPLLCSLFDQN
ncbi:MAG: CHASE2 domain-containing protein [Crocosphaera sp.]